MGCFWSSESDLEKCRTCPRKAVNNLIIINGVCESCKTYYERRERARSQPNRCFGEYKCSCGRYWTSTHCWPGNYQNCQKCQREVIAFKTRELRDSDMNGETKTAEHPRHLCQRCREVGRYCGRVARAPRSRSAPPAKRIGNYKKY